MAQDLEIIDVHAHASRDAFHAQEMRDYFLPAGSDRSGNRHVQGTTAELQQMMSQVGTNTANILMFTWAGKYYRDGQFVLPDDPNLLDSAEDDLRRRVATRVVDNNEWAVRAVNENPNLTFFAGINPVVMDPHEMVAEIENKVKRGALGIVVMPDDVGVSGSHRLFFPAYEYCEEFGIPIHIKSGKEPLVLSPIEFEDAFRNFPKLKIIFSHMGNNPVFGKGTDQEVVDLARKYEGVYTDTSLRFASVANGLITPESMVRQLRSVGTERVLFGSNYFYGELFKRAEVKKVPKHVDSHFTEAWKSVQVLKSLPLTDEERENIAAKNFRSLTGLVARCTTAQALRKAGRSDDTSLYERRGQILPKVSV